MTQETTTITESEETTVEETQNVQQEKPVRVPNPHRDELICKCCIVAMKCLATVGVVAATFSFASWAWETYRYNNPRTPWVELSPYLGKYPVLWNKDDGRVLMLTTNKKLKPTWREVVKSEKKGE